VLVIMAVIVNGLFQYVIPQFVNVIHEISDGEMPVITQWLILIWEFCSGPLQVGLGIIIGVWAIGTLIGWLKRSQRPNWIINITDWFRWHLPFIHRFDRMFGLIQLLETLNLCLSSGSPVDQAVSECRNLDVNRCFRRRIRRWHRAIVQGQSVSEAAIDSGLPRSVAWAFDSNVNQGNTPNILAMLEQSYNDRYVYHSNLLSLIFSPVITMILAAIVCFVMLAVFLPMISTISHLIEIYP
jgi:type IV pilus assembly protein PilC